MKIAMVDGSNVLNIVYGSRDCFELWHTMDESEFKTNFMNALQSYMSNYLEGLEKCSKGYFCVEGFESKAWRKEIYPIYKANRKSKDEDERWKYFKLAFEVAKTYIELNTDFVYAKVDKCEGDDVIAILTDKYTSNSDIVYIYSSDKDLTQLCVNNEKALVYDLKNKIWINSNNVDVDIVEKKCTIGDSSDNIKGVKGLGEKKYEKMKSDSVLYEQIMAENKEEIELCRKIVDFKLIPTKIRELVLAFDN